jgi:cytoskeletal protein RodZ
MPNANFEQDHKWFHRGVEKLKREVALLEARLYDLEQKNLRPFSLVQKLGKYLGFSAAGKVEWARFRLKFKQEELDRFKAQPEMSEATANRNAPLAERAQESTRQKMERMITENPAELEPHIRRVYQPLLEAGK